MSASYTSYAVIGIEIALDGDGGPNLILPRTVRGCEHEVPDDMKFCPECGKPREEETEAYFDLQDLKLENLSTAFDTDYKHMYLGAVVEGDDYSRGEKLPVSKCIKVLDELNKAPIIIRRKEAKIPDEFKEILIKLIADNLESYGIWAVQYCSY